MGLVHTASRARRLEEARQVLERARGQALSRDQRGALAVELAAVLLRAARAASTPDERTRQAMLGRLVHDPHGQAFTTALTDRVFRSRDARRVVEQLGWLCERLGAPRYMPWHARAQLGTARLFGGALPKLTGSAVLTRVRHEARAMVLAAERERMEPFLSRRRAEGVRVNVNQLGEALLGEREAEARVRGYEQLARDGRVDALSVKVSSVGSQLNLLAFEHTTATLAERLARIYRATLARPDRERPRVMLDMEAYGEVHLTCAVLKHALADETLSGVRAGLVLQAYLPDSNELLQDLVSWSEQRVARGQPALRVRIVKGANLAHERVESAKSGLALPIFASKREVDANYKRLLEAALAAVQRGAIELGVASHNLFDLAYALLLREERGRPPGLGIEMLEGMANDAVRVLVALGVDVLVYAPVCSDEAMSSGIAYLVRRLDENTAHDNFLRASFTMQPGDSAFALESQRFTSALACVDELDERPLRERPTGAPSGEGYRGELDSDLTRASTRRALRDALWDAQQARARTVRSCIAGAEVAGGPVRAGADPSRPSVVPYHVALAGAEDIQRALACAAADPRAYASSSAEERIALLGRIAQELRGARGALIACLVGEAGKRVVEADVEVSEAVDFAEYYRRSYQHWQSEPHVAPRPRGTVLVTPPWNFPLAIAAGGVLAALVAGNRVILKPSLETVAVGELLCQLCWRAGVPREVLQLVVCEDEVASNLVRDERVDSVILTGATSTARLFQRMRPGLHLMAETGGKNAYIVTAMSDRELAIRDVVHSAFGHAGQKCSAASLLILEGEVYDDVHFLSTLKDAVQSLHVGSAWDERSFVTPLIAPPQGPLLQAIEQLEPGESWLLEPRIDADNPCLVSPGVKLGVRPGSFMHTTELFGPVLAVMRAASLDEAIQLANATGYALTAGLASLDEREQAKFIERVRAGNLYVNRTITGAIVGRQPFGGFDKSGFGPGAKAGGPNYVAQLCRFVARSEPDAVDHGLAPAGQAIVAAFERLLAPHEGARLRRYVADYTEAQHNHFAIAHDPCQVLGQDNLFSYRPAERVLLRAESDAALFDLAASCTAAALVGCRLELSIAPELAGFAAHALPKGAHIETLQQLEQRAGQRSRLRLLGTRTRLLDQLAAALGCHVADEPVLPSGRHELLHYVREQTLSMDYHRYGNLGARALPGDEGGKAAARPSRLTRNPGPL